MLRVRINHLAIMVWRLIPIIIRSTLILKVKNLMGKLGPNFKLNIKQWKRNQVKKVLDWAIKYSWETQVICKISLKMLKTIKTSKQIRKRDWQNTLSSRMSIQQALYLRSMKFPRLSRQPRYHVWTWPIRHLQARQPFRERLRNPPSLSHTRTFKGLPLCLPILTPQVAVVRGDSHQSCQTYFRWTTSWPLPSLGTRNQSGRKMSMPKTTR